MRLAGLDIYIFGRRYIYNYATNRHTVKAMAWDSFYLPSASRRFLMPLLQTTFWKNCGKCRNCTWWAISTFVTTYSAFLIVIHSFKCAFLYVCLNVFKGVCWIFVVSGKVLTGKGQQKRLQKPLPFSFLGLIYSPNLTY